MGAFSGLPVTFHGIEVCMFNRHRRVLWLLNHKTLMPFEVALLIELGYEVFTPKVLPPPARFRSAAIDFSYDASLSIPESALRRLNEFDFYESEWPDDIVTLINRYFGAAFIMPFGKQVPEALAKFEGQIIFRAFGLDNSQTYKRVLEGMYGPSVFALIKAIGDRFWFGQGYEQLTECEPPLIAEHAIFLPLGVPESFWSNVDQYTGTDHRILFVCPNIVSNSYYAAVYAAFKQDFGDLPHIIVGAQDVEVSDPNVAGFVSNEELARLFRECVVNYYHSTELRHVHYSPIEAAINGMPVIYFAESLLGRMTEGVTHGRCGSIAEARAAIERILAGDNVFTHQVRVDQKALSHQFSVPYCKEVWIREIEATDFRRKLAAESWWKVLGRELAREVLRPFAKGLSRIPPRQLPPMPSYFDLGVKEADIPVQRTIEDGIDFREDVYPLFVSSVSGVSFPESAGRWSTGKSIVIDFANPLPRRFQLTILGGAYEQNIGADVEIRIDGRKQLIRFDTEAGNSSELSTEWRVGRRARRIEISVPHPIQPPGDNRTVGLALEAIRVKPLQ